MNQQISTRRRGFGKPSPPMVDPVAARKHDPGMEARIRNLESHAIETRDRLMRIETTLGHVATAGDVAASSICLRKEMGDMKAELVTLIARSHADMIKWSIMSMLTVSTLAFTAAKYIH